MSASVRRWVIDCVRHGECEGPRDMLRGRTDVALTKVGLQRTCDTLMLLGRPDRVVSSPLTRCQLPAQHCAQQWQLPVMLDDRLQELDFGAWDGRPMSELYQSEPDALAQFWSDAERYPPPQGERWQAFLERITHVWVALPETSPGHTIIVTHAGVIKTWVAAALGVPMSSNTDHIARIALPYAGLVRFVIEQYEGHPPLTQLVYLGGPDMPLPASTLLSSS